MLVIIVEIVVMRFWDVVHWCIGYRKVKVDEEVPWYVESIQRGLER